MQLNIENMANIQKTDIVIKGITVISGAEDTGKYNTGKILEAVRCGLDDVRLATNSLELIRAFEKSFHRQFRGQLYTLNPNSPGVIEYITPQENIRITFDKNNIVEVVKEPADTPEEYLKSASVDVPSLIRKYQQMLKDNNGTIPFENTNPLKDVYRRANKLCPGHIDTNDNGELLYQDPKMEDPYFITNISRNLERFAHVKMIAALGREHYTDSIMTVTEGDRLHPDQQLIYAENLVVLQKLLNLRLLIITNSPYLVRAFQIYTAKHDTSDGTHWYLSQHNNVQDYCEIVNVDGKVTELFAVLAAAFKQLELEASWVLEQ